MRVAIVGGGASGTLTAAQLARQAGRTGNGVEIVLIEPHLVGQGVAYSTTDERHRLNVPASGMSALPDDPHHLVRWLRANLRPDFAPSAFAPRRVYSHYLRDTLHTALTKAPTVRFEHVRTRVERLRRTAAGIILTGSGGERISADAVVLALGQGSPATAWAPQALRASNRFVADPWEFGKPAAAVPAGGTVLLVGTGLTMVDMAMCFPDATVHAASRHGMLPLPHARNPVTSAPPALPAQLTPTAARRLVFDIIRRNDGDWRAAVDSMRPVTARIWAGWDDAQRAEFAHWASRRWERVRHRVDPDIGDWLDRRRADGTLVLHAGTVAAARELPGGIEVTLADGTAVTADLVVNCTGSCASLGTVDDPFVTDLLASGLARLGPLDLGLATDGTGRLDSPGCYVPLPVWTLGPLRRGELWETTAIPEIRCQAEQIASAVLAKQVVAA